jgi:hypothetical protein
MNKTLTISMICCLYLGFISHSSGQIISDQQKLVIEKQVDSIFHGMVKAAENLEYDKLSEGVDDRHHAGFITNGSYYAQYDSLIRILTAKSRGVTKQTITIQKEKISVLSKRIVLLTACGDTKVEVSSGDQFTVKFYWSFVYEKNKGAWKVIQSSQSSTR